MSQLSSPAREMKSSHITSPIHPLSPAPSLSNTVPDTQIVQQHNEPDNFMQVDSPGSPVNLHSTSPCAMDLSAIDEITHSSDGTTIHPVHHQIYSSQDNYEHNQFTAKHSSSPCSDSSRISSPVPRISDSLRHVQHCPLRGSDAIVNPLKNDQSCASFSSSSTPSTTPVHSNCNSSLSHSSQSSTLSNHPPQTTPSKNPLQSTSNYSSRNTTPVHISDKPLASNTSSPISNAPYRQKSTSADKTRHHPYNPTAVTTATTIATTTSTTTSTPTSSATSVLTSSTRSLYDNHQENDDDEELIIVAEMQIDESSLLIKDSCSNLKNVATTKSQSEALHTSKLSTNDPAYPITNPSTSSNSAVRMRSVESPSVDFIPQTPPINRVQHVNHVKQEYRNVSPPPPTYHKCPSIDHPSSIPVLHNGLDRVYLIILIN